MTEHLDSSAVRQEPNAISTRAVVLAGLVVLAVSGVGVWTMDLIWRARRAEHGAPPPISRDINASPLERTNVMQTARGQDLQERARHQLNEWGWVDPGKVARIPVSEAGRWLLRDAQRGRLTWHDQEAGPAPSTSAPTPPLSQTGAPLSSSAPPKEKSGARVSKGVIQ